MRPKDGPKRRPKGGTDAFAGLRAAPGAPDNDAGAANLLVLGLPATPLDDPRAAAWASSDEHLVPCGAERVDRFDGRLLLDEVSRWERPYPTEGAAAPPPPSRPGGAAEGALDAERYRDLDPAKEGSLMLSGPQAPLWRGALEGGDGGSGGDAGACWVLLPGWRSHGGAAAAVVQLLLEDWRLCAAAA
jgi:hypothetical protein